MPWWWVFIFEHNLDRLYPQYVNFVEGVDLRHTDWQYDRDYLSKHGLMVATRRSEDRAFAWVFPYRQVQHRYGPDPQEEGEEAYAIGFAKAWERHTNACYDPIRDENPERFPQTTAQSYSFKNMAAGSYRLEFWETWKTQAPERSEIQHTGGNLEIIIPPISRDIAIKLVRVVQP
jgi:hypothetical protein